MDAPASDLFAIHRRVADDVIACRRASLGSATLTADWMLPIRGPLVHDSLSIIVPVRNAEATLSSQVHHLLDILPDLTSRFQIVIVDDASTDHTAELAHDLARSYPQIIVMSHSRPHGYQAAVQSGLRAAQGQTILVQEDSASVSPTDLRRLWSLRHDRGTVMARTQQRPAVFEPELLERLSTWAQSLRNLARRTAPGGVQMIRRDEAEAIGGGNVLLRNAVAQAAQDR